jgi:hypothetical protein
MGYLIISVYNESIWSSILIAEWRSLTPSIFVGNIHGRVFTPKELFPDPDENRSFVSPYPGEIFANGAVSHYF